MSKDTSQILFLYVFLFLFIVNVGNRKCMPNALLSSSIYLFSLSCLKLVLNKK